MAWNWIRQKYPRKFGWGVPNFSLVVDGSEIPHGVKLKYLEVTIASSLKWNTHIANVVGKANKLLGLIRRALKSAMSKTCMHRGNAASNLLMVWYSSLFLFFPREKWSKWQKQMASNWDWNEWGVKILTSVWAIERWLVIFHMPVQCLCVISKSSGIFLTID